VDKMLSSATDCPTGRTLFLVFLHACPAELPNSEVYQQKELQSGLYCKGGVLASGAASAAGAAELAAELQSSRSGSSVENKKKLAAWRAWSSAHASELAAQLDAQLSEKLTAPDLNSSAVNEQ